LRSEQEAQALPIDRAKRGEIVSDDATVTDEVEIVARPALRIVSGSPSPEELAVLTAIVAAAGGGDDASPRVRRGGWNDPAAMHQRPLIHGPNAWRSATR
jgi:hypothetical protein